MTGRYGLAAHLLPRLVAVGLVCMALAATAAAADGKRLTTETEFRELVVDRQLTRDRTVFSYTGDGRISGVVRGERFEGTWNWAGATVCRTATLGSRDLGNDCLAVFVIGDLVIVVRDEGRGHAFALRVRNEDRQPADTEEFLVELACRGTCG